MKKLASSCQIILTLVILAVLSAPSAMWADEGPAHKTYQTRPIQLGTTGGNINDSSAAFCCSGTLGSLVQNAATQFILSNNHVLARTNQAAIGEDIIQPGLIDQDPVCSKDATDGVADLFAFVKISFKNGTTNTVDAAIAQARTGAVDMGGSILDIRQVSSFAVIPALEMAVKKSGRTTGLTTGKIKSNNVTADVLYSKQCGVGSQKARFVNQISITSETSFSKGGDSGSLVVEDVATCPRAVGLLFAGSSSITLANPISDVLSAFGVSMVGCSGGSASQEKSLFRRVVAWLFPTASAEGPPGNPGPPVDPADLAKAIQVKEKHEEALLGIPGVVGVGVGLSDVVPGEVVIEIYHTEELKAALPTELEGVPVQTVETEPFVAFGKSCGEAL